MISKFVGYPEKIFKTFVFQFFSLLLLTGILLLTISSFKNGIANKYSFINDNEIFELFETEDDNNTSYIDECKKKASYYSSITKNNVEEYYPFLLNTIELDFPANNVTSVIKRSIEYVVCDNLSSFINFYHEDKAKIILESDNEEGIYISYDLYEKYQNAYDWTYKYTYYNEEVDNIVELIIPIKGVYEKSDSHNFNNHMYMSFSLYSLLLKEVSNSHCNGCIYQFKNNITTDQIDKINQKGTLEINSKIMQINKYLTPFAKIIDFSFILLIVSTIVMEVSLASLVVQRNLKNKEIDKIENIFYKKEKDDIFRTIIKSFILVLGILMISYILLLIISLILSTFIKIVVLPSIAIFLIGAITYFVLIISDLLSKKIIKNCL